MLSALLIAVAVQSGVSPVLPRVSPILPAGSNASVHQAFRLVAEDTMKGRFDQAKAKLALLPKYTITYTWNDQGLTPAQRKEWITVRNDAFRTLTNRVPGLTLKEVASKPILKFSFEKSLAPDPETGLPRGIALFWSDSITEPRLEAVIGINRGKPLEQTTFVSLHNEIVFTIGSYLGLAPVPFQGRVMGRSDLQMQYKYEGDINELGAFTSIQKAATHMTEMVGKQLKVEPTTPKIAFNPEVIERGPVIQGSLMDFSVQVSNIGNGALQVRVIPDCQCVTAGGAPVINAESSVAIPMRVDTKDIVGLFSRHIIVISNDPEKPVQVVPIHIRTTPRYQFLSKEPSVLIVDSAGLDTELFLAIPKEKPMEVTGIELQGMQGTATFEPWEGNLPDPTLQEASKPRKGYRIKLHLKEPPVSGRVAAIIVAKTTDPKYAAIKHAVFAQKGIAAMPASIFYGDLGTAERQASIILTRPNKPFKILKVESDSAFVDGEVIATKDPWEYKLSCKYNGKAPQGDFRAMITLTTDDPKQAKIRVPVMGTVK